MPRNYDSNQIVSRPTPQTYRQPTRAERAEEHRWKMQARKRRLAERTPGFDPVSNDRITSTYQALRASLHKAYKDISTHESHNTAMQNLRDRLPPMRRDAFQQRPATAKQDTVPGYVKPNVRPKSARVQPREMRAAA